MSKGLTLSVAFALGLLYGRRSGARYVEVPPRIVFVPPSSAAAPQAPPADLKGVLRELLGGAPGGEELDRLAEAVEQILGAVQRRDLCLRRIEEASRAFMEGRISRSTYAFLVRLYQRRLIEAEAELAKLEGAVARGGS